MRPKLDKLMPMTTRALGGLVIPMRRTLVDPHETVRALHTYYTDPDVKNLHSGFGTPVAAAWIDDLETPGATFIAWESSFHSGFMGDGETVPRGSGYAYIDPRRLADQSGWNLQRCERTIDGDRTTPRMALEVWSSHERWRSLVRPLPAGFAVRLPRRLTAPQEGEPLQASSLLLGPNRAQWVLWRSASRGGCWTDDVPCAEAVRYGGRYGQELQPARSDELEWALRILGDHAISSRLQGL
jgi:hypothetical protein